MNENSNKFILIFTCKDTKGIVAAVSNFLLENDGFILESAQIGDDTTGQFFMRTVFTSAIKYDILVDQFGVKVANNFQMNWKLYDTKSPLRLLLMVSKQLHCLNDLLHRYASKELFIEIPAIISNHLDAEKIANWYDIPFYHFPVSPENKEEQENKVLNIIKENNIDLTVLARYMQVLSPKFVDNIYGNAINIHHSFLPSFKGAKPYHQAFARGVKIIGATAHYVSNELDEGPIIEQEVSRVDHAHTPEEFVNLGKDIESKVLSLAVKYHTEHRIILNGNKTVVFH